MKLEIEKDVLFTGAWRGDDQSIRSQLRAMEIGDSFLVNIEFYGSVRATAGGLGRTENMKFKSAKQDSLNYRVWRIS